MEVKSWREKRVGTLGGFSGNTLQRISTVAPVPVRGADVFSVKNTRNPGDSARRVKHMAGICVCRGERKGGRES